MWGRNDRDEKRKRSGGGKWVSRKKRGKIKQKKPGE